MDESHGAFGGDAEALSSCEECGSTLERVEAPTTRDEAEALVCHNRDCGRWGMYVWGAAKARGRSRADVSAARSRHAEEAAKIAEEAAAMTIDDVPRIERVPADRQDAHRADALASYQTLAAYMADRGSTRWSESERKWADVLGVSRRTAMRRLLRLQAIGWIALDRRPITVERSDGTTRYVRPTVKARGTSFATTTGGQTRVRLIG